MHFSAKMNSRPARSNGTGKAFYSVRSGQPKRYRPSLNFLAVCEKVRVPACVFHSSNLWESVRLEPCEDTRRVELTQDRAVILTLVIAFATQWSTAASETSEK
jgi:hypothetical protein